MSGCYPSEGEEVCIHGFPIPSKCDLCALHLLVANNFASLNIRIESLHCNKLQQIDENRKISRRVDELEKAYKADLETAKELIFQGVQTHASILRCEAKIKELENSDYDERITDLENIGAEQRLLRIESVNSKKPHKCPVCEGSGKVKHPLNGLLLCQCDVCEGKGIVWG